MAPLHLLIILSLFIAIDGSKSCDTSECRLTCSTSYEECTKAITVDKLSAFMDTCMGTKCLPRVRKGCLASCLSSQGNCKDACSSGTTGCAQSCQALQDSCEAKCPSSCSLGVCDKNISCLKTCREVSVACAGSCVTKEGACREVCSTDHAMGCDSICHLQEDDCDSKCSSVLDVPISAMARCKQYYGSSGVCVASCYSRAA